MNLSNAVGKFGALLIDVTTCVKETLTSVSDEFMEWLGTEGGKSALRTAVTVAVKSLTGAHELFKKEVAKLFAPVGELNFPGFTEKWKPGEFFTTTNQKTKFYHVDSDLITFLTEEGDGSPARKLVIQQLRWNAKDSEILLQLGDVPDLTPAEFRWLLEKGNLARGQWYVGYITKGGVRRAVDFLLSAGGWRVGCWAVPGARDWGVGSHFVSPAKSCESLGA